MQITDDDMDEINKELEEIVQEEQMKLPEVPTHVPEKVKTPVKEKGLID